MSPADELRAAATRLEETAAGATAGPWRARYTDRYGYAIPDPAEDWGDDGEGEGEFNLLAGTALPVSRNGDEERDSGHYEPQHVIAEYDDHDSPGQDRERWANLQWAAILNPLVAAPLVVLLRAAADAADNYPALEDPGSHVSRMVADPDQAGSYRYTAHLIRNGLAFARVINGTTS